MCNQDDENKCELQKCGIVIQVVMSQDSLKAQLYFESCFDIWEQRTTWLLRPFLVYIWPPPKSCTDVTLFRFFDTPFVHFLAFSVKHFMLCSLWDAAARRRDRKQGRYDSPQHSFQLATCTRTWAGAQTLQSFRRCLSARVIEGADGSLWEVLQFFLHK